MSYVKVCLKIMYGIIDIGGRLLPLEGSRQHSDAEIGRRQNIEPMYHLET